MLAKKNTKTTQKKEFFEVYRVLWVLEFVETDLEDQHLQIKIFYIYKLYPSVFIWGVCFLLLSRFQCLLPPVRSICIPLFSNTTCAPKFYMVVPCPEHLPRPIPIPCNHIFPRKSTKYAKKKKKKEEIILYSACTGLGWGRVNFFHSSRCGALLWIGAGTGVGDTGMVSLLRSWALLLLLLPWQRVGWGWARSWDSWRKGCAFSGAQQ